MTYEMDSLEAACASFGAQYWPSPASISTNRSPTMEHTVGMISSAILISILAD